MASFERCWCTGVDRELVVAAIRRAGCRTVDEVRRASGACYGCQSCRPELEQLLLELRRIADTPTGAFEALAPEAAAPGPGPAPIDAGALPPAARAR